MGQSWCLGYFYDLASLTKVVGTASGIFYLLDQGRIQLEDQVGNFFDTGFDQVTIKELLLRNSGLALDLENVWQYASPVAVWEAVMASKQLYQPGMDSVYSDLNFIVLGKIMETIYQRPLNEILQEQVFQHLGIDLDNKRAIIILTNAVYPKRGNTDWQEARRAAAAVFWQPVSKRLTSVNIVLE